MGFTPRRTQPRSAKRILPSPGMMRWGRPAATRHERQARSRRRRTVATSLGRPWGLGRNSTGRSLQGSPAMSTALVATTGRF